MWNTLFQSWLLCLYGSVPERSNGEDCKSFGFAFVGSNPTRPTITYYKSYRQEVIFEENTRPDGGMVDTTVLEAVAARCESSSLSSGTKLNEQHRVYSGRFYVVHWTILYSGSPVLSGSDNFFLMKKDIHPNTYKIKVSCSCGNSFETLSTIKGGELKVETCQNCHPFYTGEKRLLKTSSVDKFYARQKKAEKLQK